MIPTPYADPHIGHAWMAWLNYDAAWRTGGEFTLRFDDTTYERKQLWRQGYSLEHSCERWVDQLTWLCGGPPDKVAFSSENAAAHEEAWARLGLKPPRPTREDCTSDWPFGVGVPQQTAFALAHYHPATLVYHVVDDALGGIDGFYSGMEFLPEAHLYDFFCRQLGWRPPVQCYMPCVRRAEFAVKESKGMPRPPTPVGEIGQPQPIVPSLGELRAAGYEPWMIVDTLRECADRAKEKGLRDVVVPEGHLWPGEVKWLEWRGFEKGLRANAAGGYERAGADCGDDIKRACNVARRERREARRSAQPLRA